MESTKRPNGGSEQMARTSPSKKTPAPQGPAKPAHTLAQIADQIRALEKRTVHTIIETGKWLEEAAEQCDHGTFMKWVATEFGWSHSTALNFRNVYALSQNRKIYEFEHPDIAISGLYLAARFLKDDQPSDVQAAGNAILDAAKLRRISYTEACDIADEHLSSKVDVGSQVDRDDSGADEPEEIEDEDSDEPKDSIDQLMVKAKAEIQKGDAETSKAEAHFIQAEKLSLQAKEIEADEAPPIADEAPAASSYGITEHDHSTLKLAHLQNLLETPLDNPFWSSFARHVGPAKLLEFIVKLQVVCDRHCPPAEVDSDKRSAEEIAVQALHS
jgi:hypothetical protein